MNERGGVNERWEPWRISGGGGLFLCFVRDIIAGNHMEWSDPPSQNASSNGRLTWRLCSHHSPPPSKWNTYLLPLAKSKRNNDNNKKNWQKRKTSCFQLHTNLSIYPTWVHNFWMNFVQTFVLSKCSLACLHAPAREETLGAISSYIWFLIFRTWLLPNHFFFSHQFCNDVQSQWLALCRMWPFVFLKIKKGKTENKKSTLEVLRSFWVCTFPLTPVSP